MCQHQVTSLEGTCYTFLRLDKKTYFIEFGFKMFICEWYNWRGGGAMMWMSYAMDGNKQEGKQLGIKHSALKWIKVNNVFPKGSL
jgi:hypothetical protein